MCRNEKYVLLKIEMGMVFHNGNIRHCAWSALRPVGIPPSHGRHLALTRQFSLVGILPVGIWAHTRYRVGAGNVTMGVVGYRTTSSQNGRTRTSVLLSDNTTEYI